MADEYEKSAMLAAARPTTEKSDGPDKVLPSLLAVTGRAVLPEQIGSARRVASRMCRCGQRRDQKQGDRPQMRRLPHGLPP